VLGVLETIRDETTRAETIRSGVTPGQPTEMLAVAAIDVAVTETTKCAAPVRDNVTGKKAPFRHRHRVGPETTGAGVMIGVGRGTTVDSRIVTSTGTANNMKPREM
jgi:hypothetical protein